MPTPATAPHLTRPQLRYARAEGWGGYVEAILRGFHEDYVEEVWRPYEHVFEPERSLGFQVDDRWVATAGAYTRRMSVPGGSVPVAAVTAVTVQPTYRRRGLLRDMMLHQLADVHGRGEPIAALWASEAMIYGRFGYGHAAPRLRLQGPTRRTAFRRDVDLGGGSVAEVSREDALAALPHLHKSWLTDRPGALDRTDAWWSVTLQDHPQSRDGGAAARFALHHDIDGRPDGYAVFRVKKGVDQDLEAMVIELDAAVPSAYAALWRFVLDLDLVRSVTKWGCPTDEPLRHLLDDDRALRTELIDGLYVRLVDVAAALQARRYAAAIDVRLEVDDPVLPHNAGHWRLDGGPEGAQVSRGAGGADVSLGVRELGTVYLGGVSLTSLARAGLVREHTEGAVARLATALAGERAPFCPDLF